MSASQPDPTEIAIARHARTIRDSATALKADAPWLVDAWRRDRRAGRVTRTESIQASRTDRPGGRGRGGVSDPTGSAATDLVAVERGDRDWVDDPFHDDVVAAVAELEAAAVAVGAAVQRIARMRRLQGEAPNVQWCEACLAGGVRHPWDRVARDLRGLVAPAHLCEAAYQFVSKRGRLPSPEEVVYHDAKGRWRVRVDPTATTSLGVGA